MKTLVPQIHQARILSTATSRVPGPNAVGASPSLVVTDVDALGKGHVPRTTLATR